MGRGSKEDTVVVEKDALPEERWKPCLEAVQFEVKRLKKRKSRRGVVFGTVCRILFVVMAAVLINTYVVRVATVNGGSMEPTLRDQDIVLCLSWDYTPNYGDIIVTEMDVGGGHMVKRIIALPGDLVNVDFTSGLVTVNGKVLDEPYINDLTTLEGDVLFPLTVLPGRVFVMGDNRNHSVDSRRSVVGMVPECTILGKVIFRIFPLAGVGTIR